MMKTDREIASEIVDSVWVHACGDHTDLRRFVDAAEAVIREAFAERMKAKRVSLRSETNGRFVKKCLKLNVKKLQDPLGPKRPATNARKPD